MISFLFTAGREQLDSTLGIFLEIYIYIYLKGYILFELNSIALKFIHIGFLSRQRQSIRKRKVQSVPQSPHSLEKLEKKKREIFFYSSFSLPFQISSTNLAETSTSPLPPPFLYLNAQIKSKSFLKIRDLIALSLLFRIIVICANTFANTCIPLLEDKKTWGDKKTSVESENYSHAFLSSPSYLHCYLKKINS